MKTNFIKDLETGTKLTSEQFAVKGIRHGKTASGSDYIDLILRDKTGEINAKIWESNIGNCAEVEIGQVVEISGNVDEFREKQQLKISFLQEASDFDLGDFLPVSEKDLDKVWKTVQDNIKKIKNKHIQRLLDYFFLDNDFAEKFKKAPGAERIHHAYIGGLMEHTAEMLDSANALIPNYPKMDKDLLICGTLLHDIGKMQELAVSHTIYRTLEGSMVGHISLGSATVSKAIDSLKDFPIELRAKILNMILGHHERLEYGSPVRPMTREAFALAYIDNLSAKVNTAQKVYNANEGNDVKFSDRDFALETKLYLN